MSEKNSAPGLSGLIVIAFLIAIEIVLTRLLSINTPIVRIGLAFIPVSLTAMMYGPLWAAAAYAIGDVIGALLFPTGAFFPGFTLTAFLTGAVYGVFLYRRPIGWLRVLPPAIIVCVLLNLCLDSFWLYILMGKGFIGYLPARALKAAIMLPLQVALIPLVWRYVERFAPSSARPPS
ncbi:MAG: folate family ECF transporter S component [Clostridiales Family XIII bacterium]|jgi:ECF transporter S component (folate family)|nr:folate family ECF transporter S component [Clostridiales Family XIII bacterium]